MKYLTKEINLPDKIVLLMGLGLNGGGLGSALYLAPKVKKLIITDLKSKQELLPSLERLKNFNNIEYHLNGHYLDDFLRADIIFKGAGIKYSNQYIKAAIENDKIIDTDIGYFFELANFPVIGITGSKGKSTTTTLIYQILSSEIEKVILGGNIAVSPLVQIEEKKDAKFAVLELSSWQLSDLAVHRKSPDIAVLTTIFPDHLNFYNSMEEYYEDKKNIFKYQNKDNYTVINVCNEYLYKSIINNEINSRMIFVANLDEYSLDEYTDKNILQKLNSLLSKEFCFFTIKYKDNIFLLKNKNFNFNYSLNQYFKDNYEYAKYNNILKQINMEINIKQNKGIDIDRFDLFVLPSISKVKLKGEHNYTNILLSISTAIISGIKIDNIYNTIQSFEGPEFRLQTIREFNGITFINDTTATVPDAVAASILALKNIGRIILIAGGVDKKLPVDKMAECIAENVYKLYLLEGSGSDILKNRLLSYGFKSFEDGFKDLTKLVEYAYKNAEGNDIILLSPGFASFNLFVNEFDRGKIFNQAVSSLK